MARRLAVNARVGCPERDLSSLRADQPLVPVIGLVSHRVTDLLQVEAAQVKHQARLDPSPHRQRWRSERTASGRCGIHAKRGRCIHVRPGRLPAAVVVVATGVESS